MPRSVVEPTRSQRFVYGLLAGGAALLALLAGRWATGRPGLLEKVADAVPRLIPLALFEQILDLFGPLAKQLLFAGVAGGVVVSAGLFALTAIGRPTRSPLTHALLLTFFSLAIAELIVLPLLGEGLLGSSMTGDPLALQLPLLAAALLYGAVLAGQLDRPRRATLAGTDQPAVGSAGGGIPRRSFIARTMGLVGGGSLAISAVAIAGQVGGALSARRPRAETDFPPGGFGPTAALTPVPEFYRVDKNALPVTVDGSAWRLRVDGLVERPRDYSLEEIQALPVEEAHRTLACISFNIVQGDDLIGNQLWKGTRVAGILDEVGVRSEGRFVLWEAEDGYTESIPIEVARDDDTWIVYEMGGEPLTADHGYPARVFIAGRFGMKQPKWVNRLTVSANDADGYWEQRGWDRDAFVRTMSRIDHPLPGDAVPAGSPWQAYGIAYSGERAILRVEVSPDDGTTWVEARLEDASRPPLGPQTWVRWRAELTLASPGAARLVCRATDGDGAVQDGTERPPLPSGATGWHAIRVVAVEGLEG